MHAVVSNAGPLDFGRMIQGQGIAQKLKDSGTLLGNRLSYLPGLDGLRALAVMAVVFYHAEVPWLPGGFLGVEVFFVVSGYLITSLLLAEWHEKGRIDLKSFWLRRARRLLPALYLLILFTLAFAELFLRQEVPGLRKDALAALGYITNWYLVFDHKSYFELAGRPPLLRHLWSLAVEEQFYVLWPLLFIAGMRLLRRRFTLLAVAAGAVSSAMLMALLYQPEVDPSRIYYGTDTRASALLVGSALAFVWMPRPKQNQMRLAQSLAFDALGLMALGVVAILFFRLDEFQPFLYQGGFPLLASATAVAIAVVVHPNSYLGSKLLGWRVLRWIGQRSYGIYLWHWPVFMVTRPQLDVSFDGLPLLGLRFVVVAALVELSYRYVETPIRRGGLGRAWQALCHPQYVQQRRAIGWWCSAVLAVAFIMVLGACVATASPEAATAGPEILETATSAVATPTASTPSVAVKIEKSATPTPDSDDLPSSGLQPQPESVSPTPPPTTAPSPDKPSVLVVRVTAIGDSVMLGAARELQAAIEGIEIDAEVGRQASDVLHIVQTRHASGRLGEMVVIQAGNNGTFTAKQFDDMMVELVDVRRVVFVNLKVPRRWEESDNRVIAEGVKRYRNAVMVDWHAASASAPETFADDGIHFGPTGARVYTELVVASLKAP